MNAARLRIYWGAWSGARDALRRAGVRPADMDAARRFVHVRVIGRDVGHRDLDEIDFVLVTSEFRRIARTGVDAAITCAQVLRAAAGAGVKDPGQYLDVLASRLTGKKLNAVDATEAAKIRGVFLRKLKCTCAGGA